MGDVAARRIEEQQRDDAEKGEGNDGSQPSELEEDGTAGCRTPRAALRRCLCHAGILSQRLATAATSARVHSSR